MHKDNRYILSFYSLILLSIFFFFYILDDPKMPLKQYYLYHMGMGAFWLISGGTLNYLLNQLYQKPFMQMKRQEKRSVVISILVIALGAYLLIWSLIRWYALK